MKKAVIFSVFESQRFGIARYPLEEVQALKAGGWEVLCVGLTAESEGIRNFDLAKFRDAGAFLLYILNNRWEKVSFHFYHGFVFPHLGGGLLVKLVTRLLQLLCLFLLGFLNRDSAVVIHEIPLDNQIIGFRRVLCGFSLRGFKRIEVFTATVLERLIRTYPMLCPGRVVVVDHGRHMQQLFRGSREEARRRLGVELAGRMFLCIGFWGPQKGFDMAVRAMKSALRPTGKLCIVGSLNGSSEELSRHRDALRDLSEGCDRVSLIERYVTDEEFDIWIRAADTVILPYRSILNSGVGARAVAAGTELWVSDLPELVSQFPSATVFWGEEELARLFEEKGEI